MSVRVRRAAARFVEREALATGKSPLNRESVPEAAVKDERQGIYDPLIAALITWSLCEAFWFCSYPQLALQLAALTHRDLKIFIYF